MNRFYFFLLVSLMVGCRPNDMKTGALEPYSLNWPNHFPPAPIPSDNALTKQGVYLGKLLFFEKKMSADGTQSCASCHNQSFGFTDNGHPLSKGILGLEGKRNSMPIFNLLLHNNGFFWDGRAKSLREQSLKPIQDHLEMNESLNNVVQKLSEDDYYKNLFAAAFGDPKITEERIGLALEQYLFSIVSGDSKFDRVRAGIDSFTASEKRGQLIFNTEYNPASGKTGADCFHCHSEANFTNNQFLNNGLDSIFTDYGREKATGKSSDRGKFQTPSLRNVAVTAPYMHDGRFKTLLEVINHYDHNIKESSTLDPNMYSIKNGIHLTEPEKQDLIAFLKTLTDHTFLNNPNYR
jgi:cytochrome c peroxidase